MQIRCTICGGTYYPLDQILIGRVAESFLRSMNYDLAFFTCDGIAEDGTVSFDREETVGVGEIIVKNAKKIVLIADHSKLNKRYTYNICNTRDLDDVIVM